MIMPFRNKECHPKSGTVSKAIAIPIAGSALLKP